MNITNLTDPRMTEVIEMKSTRESINELEPILSSFLNDKCSCDVLFGDIMVALMEAVNNAICHGNKYDDNKIVRLKMRYEQNTLEFIVSDEGPGFSQDACVQNPTSVECLDQCHGRGLFLMKNLADELSYRDQGRTVVLNFTVNN